jgi:hypothetical protein
MDTGAGTDAEQKRKVESAPRGWASSSAAAWTLTRRASAMRRPNRASHSAARDAVLAEHLRQLVPRTEMVRTLQCLPSWPSYAKRVWELMEEFGLHAAARETSEMRFRMLAQVDYILNMPSEVRRIESELRMLDEKMAAAIAAGQLQEHQSIAIAAEYLDNARISLASGVDAQIVVQRLEQMAELWRELPPTRRSLRRGHAAAASSTAAAREHADADADAALLECWNAVFDQHALLPKYTPPSLCEQCRVPVVKLTTQAQLLCPACANMRQELPSIQTEHMLRNTRRPTMVTGALETGIAQQLHTGVLDCAAARLHPLAHAALDGSAVEPRALSMADVLPPPSPMSSTSTSTSPATIVDARARFDQAKAKGLLRPLSRVAGAGTGVLPASGNHEEKALLSSVQAVVDTLEQFSERGPAPTPEEIARLHRAAMDRRAGVPIVIKRVDWPAFCERAGVREMARWHALGSWILCNPGAAPPRIPETQIRAVHARLQAFAHTFRVAQLFGNHQTNWNARALTNLIAAKEGFTLIQELLPCAATEQQRATDARTFQILSSYVDAARAKSGGAGTPSGAVGGFRPAS